MCVVRGTIRGAHSQMRTFRSGYLSDLVRFGKEATAERPGVVWKEDRLKAKGVGGAMGLVGRGEG